jgi:hypothetical protein
MVILVGGILTALTVIIHAVGTTWWVQSLDRWHRSSGRSWQLRALWLVLMSTAIVMLLLHVVEVCLWAGAYRIFVPGELETFEKALYFSFVTFTSLGYGDISLSSEWRLLSGIESLSGLLAAGLSTALLFAVLQRAWGSMTKATDR